MEELATLWMELVLVLQDGEEKNVNTIVRMVLMGWTVLSVVTAAMQMAVTQLLATVAASLDGQVCIVTVYVLRDVGVQTVHCPVSVKMVHRALQMKGSVNVHLATEALLVKEFAPLDFMAIAVARHAPSVCTAVVRATM